MSHHTCARVTNVHCIGYSSCVSLCIDFHQFISERLPPPSCLRLRVSARREMS